MLAAAGVRVEVDWRRRGPAGVRFGDSERRGVPLRIEVGRRWEGWKAWQSTSDGSVAGAVTNCSHYPGSTATSASQGMPGRAAIAVLCTGIQTSCSRCNTTLRPSALQLGPRDLKQRTCVIAQRFQPGGDGKLQGVSTDPDALVDTVGWGEGELFVAGLRTRALWCFGLRAPRVRNAA